MICNIDTIQRKTDQATGITCDVVGARNPTWYYYRLYTDLVTSVVADTPTTMRVNVLSGGSAAQVGDKIRLATNEGNYTGQVGTLTTLGDDTYFFVNIEPLIASGAGRFQNLTSEGNASVETRLVNLDGTVIISQAVSSWSTRPDMNGVIDLSSEITSWLAVNQNPFQQDSVQGATPGLWYKVQRQFIYYDRSGTKVNSGWADIADYPLAVYGRKQVGQKYGNNYFDYALKFYQTQLSLSNPTFTPTNNSWFKDLPPSGVGSLQYLQQENKWSYAVPTGATRSLLVAQNASLGSFSGAVYVNVTKAPKYDCYIVLWVYDTILADWKPYTSVLNPGLGITAFGFTNEPQFSAIGVLFESVHSDGYTAEISSISLQNPANVYYGKCLTKFKVKKNFEVNAMLSFAIDPEYYQSLSTNMLFRYRYLTKSFTPSVVNPPPPDSIPISRGINHITLGVQNTLAPGNYPDIEYIEITPDFGQGILLQRSCYTTPQIILEWENSLGGRERYGFLHRHVVTLGVNKPSEIFEQYDYDIENSKGAISRSSMLQTNTVVLEAEHVDIGELPALHELKTARYVRMMTPVSGGPVLNVAVMDTQTVFNTGDVTGKFIVTVRLPTGVDLLTFFPDLIPKLV